MKAVEIGGIAKFDQNGDINNIGFRWKIGFVVSYYAVSGKA
jgi:hypothetical protein